MSIARFPDERQAVPQDLVRDEGTQPIHEDAITRVARCIFAYRWPKAWWGDPGYKSERDDCILMAAQFQEIFREKWTVFDASVHLTEQSLHLLYGDRTLTTPHRNAVQRFCEKFLGDLSRIFGGGDMAQVLDSRSKAVN